MSSMAAALLTAGHSTYVNLMTQKEWIDLGATHEDDLQYKAVEIRIDLKRAVSVSPWLLLICQCVSLSHAR